MVIGICICPWNYNAHGSTSDGEVLLLAVIVVDVDEDGGGVLLLVEEEGCF